MRDIGNLEYITIIRVALPFYMTPKPLAYSNNNI